MHSAIDLLHQFAHGHFHMLLEDRFARKKPVAVVVAHQAAKEPEGLFGETWKTGCHERLLL